MTVQAGRPLITTRVARKRVHFGNSCQFSNVPSSLVTCESQPSQGSNIQVRYVHVSVSF